MFEPRVLHILYNVNLVFRFLSARAGQYRDIISLSRYEIIYLLRCWILLYRDELCFS